MTDEQSVSVQTKREDPQLPDSVLMNPLDIHFQRERMSQMMTMADQMVKARCFGGDVQNPAQAFVKIQAGAEMGLPPMEAMNSLFIVNGKITMWGVALSKRIRQHGWKIEYTDESESKVTVKVTKGKEKHEYTATKEQLQKLRSKAMNFALADKLRWHAIARLVRFSIPEVLDNTPITYIKEEIDDIEMEETKVIEPTSFDAGAFSAPKKDDDEVKSEPKEEPRKKEKSEKQIKAEETLAKIKEEQLQKEKEAKKQEVKKRKFNIEKFQKAIDGCKTFDELNDLRAKFGKVVETDEKMGLSDDEVSMLWDCLKCKLDEVEHRSNQPADASDFDDLFN